MPQVSSKSDRKLYWNGRRSGLRFGRLWFGDAHGLHAVWRTSLRPGHFLYHQILVSIFLSFFVCFVFFVVPFAMPPPPGSWCNEAERALDIRAVP